MSAEQWEVRFRPRPWAPWGKWLDADPRALDLYRLQAADEQPCTELRKAVRESTEHLRSRLMGEADAGVVSEVTEADALEFRRDAYGLTASDFAHILGIQKSHYSETIAGKRRLPINSVARAIAIGVLVAPLLAGRKPVARRRAKKESR